MGTRDVTPLTFSPTSLSDCLDSTHAFPGACAKLQNLIPDPSTTNLWMCRPAAILLTNFPGFITPGFISAYKQIGTRAYGMIATGRFPTHDEPFCYDVPSGNFITVAGVTNPNTPVSPSPAGTWVPPTMDLIGKFLIVTHPGYNGGGGTFFGWFDLTDPANPTWNAGNTTTVPLPFPPSWVKNFFGRAYFGVNPPNTTPPAIYATSPLSLNIPVSPTQILTLDDNINLLAAAGLPLKTQIGGAIQSLLVFKSFSNVYQITGDFALTNNPISQNSLSFSAGTASPLSIVNTSKGMMFVDHDGVRLIDFQATISDPIGIAGMGVAIPFIQSLVPTRIAAASNGSIVRISTQNAAISGAPQQEYWFDLARKVWSGPHTFPASLIQPYANTFIMAPVGVLGSLWQSDCFPSTISTYVENGVQLQWDMITSMLPDPGYLGEYSINQTTINMALDPTMGSWTASVLNANAIQYDAASYAVANTAPIWDVSIWDSAIWDGLQTGLLPRRIDWSKPLPTSRAQLRFQGTSAGGIRIGDIKFDSGIVSYLPPVGL